MTEQEKQAFDTYKLTTITYINITESQARLIFNRLQNAAPMGMADIINSYESDLVEFFRETVRPRLLRGNDDYKHLKGVKLKHPDTNDDLYQFLSWYTIINPLKDSDDSDENNAMKNIEMGKGLSDNRCFAYLKEFSEQDPIDAPNQTRASNVRFLDCVDSLIRFLAEYPKLCSSWSGDIPTFIYSVCYIDNFSQEKFIDLLRLIEGYKGLDSEQSKLFKSRQIDIGRQKQQDRDTLNMESHGYLEKWVKSRGQNPAGSKNMKVRDEIVRSMCIDVPIDREVVPFIEGQPLELMEPFK